MPFLQKKTFVFDHRHLDPPQLGLPNAINPRQPHRRQPEIGRAHV
jgi:hypothetical protein